MASELNNLTPAVLHHDIFIWNAHKNVSYKTCITFIQSFIKICKLSEERTQTWQDYVSKNNSVCD